jgi:hypothetical protein
MTPEPSSRALFLLIAAAVSWTREDLFDCPRPLEVIFELLGNAPAWLQPETDPEGVRSLGLNVPLCWVLQLAELILIVMIALLIKVKYVDVVVKVQELGGGSGGEGGGFG